MTEELDLNAPLTAELITKARERVEKRYAEFVTNVNAHTARTIELGKIQLLEPAMASIILVCSDYAHFGARDRITPRKGYRQYCPYCQAPISDGE